MGFVTVMGWPTAKNRPSLFNAVKSPEAMDSYAPDVAELGLFVQPINVALEELGAALGMAGVMLAPYRYQSALVSVFSTPVSAVMTAPFTSWNSTWAW